MTSDTILYQTTALNASVISSRIATTSMKSKYPRGSQQKHSRFTEKDLGTTNPRRAKVKERKEEARKVKNEFCACINIKFSSVNLYVIRFDPDQSFSFVVHDVLEWRNNLSPSRV